MLGNTNTDYDLIERAKFHIPLMYTVVEDSQKNYTPSGLERGSSGQNHTLERCDYFVMLLVIVVI